MERLLVITNLFRLPWEPGRGLFNQQQVRELAKHHDVQVWVPVAWPVWISRPRSERRPFDMADNIRVVPFPYLYWPGMFRFSYAATLFVSLLLCRRRMGHFSPDRVLATWLYPDGVAAAWLARWMKWPLVLKAHGNDVNVQCRHRLRAAQVRRAARHADAVYCVSEDMARRLRALGVETTATIYNGIDHDIFQPRSRDQARRRLGLPDKGRLMLYAGNLKRSKGVFDLVEAVRRLPDHRYDQLYIVGDGPARQSLGEVITRSGLEEKIIPVGRRDHRELADWLAAVDLLVLPSHAEGVPNVVLEAMACGTPVVATNVGGIPEVLPDFAGIRVPVSDPGALADACAQALDRDWDRQAIHGHALGFSWPDNAAQLMSLWRPARRGESGKERDYV